jgi:hypothetical protein
VRLLKPTTCPPVVPLTRQFLVPLWALTNGGYLTSCNVVAPIYETAAVCPLGDQIQPIEIVSNVAVAAG